MKYVVDEFDRIVSVDAEWDPFARANNTPELTVEAVLGRPLLSFLRGGEVQYIYSQLLARARSGADVSFSFRCDSSERRRLLRLSMKRLEGAHVEFNSEALVDEPRDHELLGFRDGTEEPEIGTSTPDRHLVTACSWCHQIEESPGRWVELEAAVDGLALFHVPISPAFTHGICPSCAGRLQEAFDLVTTTLEPLPLAPPPAV